MNGGLVVFFVALSSVAHSTSAAPTCPRGKKWQECGPACPLSCDNYGTTVDCTLRCVPGCFCREGNVEFNGVCVHPSECPGNITVGYERTVYTTTEGQGMVELCAVVTSHPGGAPRAFAISATTRDGTAVAGTDYVRVVGEELEFNYDDTRVCHTIHILQDDISEHDPNDDFSLDLTYFSGVQPIIIVPSAVQVVIDDGDEPESTCSQGKELQGCGSMCPLTCDNYNTTTQCRLQCASGCFCPRGTVEHYNGDCVCPSQCPAVMCPPLTAPGNGQVLVSGLTPGSTAQYSCDQGYERNGVQIRTCQSDGTWSGVSPTCHPIMCPPLTAPTNGQVVVLGLSPGSTAKYSCNQWNGVQIRTCRSDGTWSGVPPTCNSQFPGSSQCYSSTTCSGSFVSGPRTLKDCCVGTDEGLSWRNGGGSCTVCIVHGFSDVEIRREEGQISSGEFTFFVKGKSLATTPVDIIVGTITDAPDTAESFSDYAFDNVDVNLEFGVTDSGVTWRLPLMDDILALEYDDLLDLEFTSSISGLVDNFEASTPPQFIRSRIRIHIVDTDDLRINHKCREYDTDESTEAFSGIVLSFSKTQQDFTVEFTPATVDESMTVYNLTQLLDLDRFRDKTQKATAGDDFITSTFSHSVIAGDRTLAIRPIPIRDDDVNENEQIFVLVIKILGQAAASSCFQVVTGDPCSSIGGAVLRIRDDDTMKIGFDTRRRIVRENQFPQSRIPIFINVVSNRRSELDYVVRVTETQSSAAVVASTQLVRDWDFAFGNMYPGGLIVSENTLLRDNTELSPFVAYMHNDVSVEETENVTMVLILRTYQDVRETPQCLTDDEDPANYFCLHTVTIIDEDEPLEVSFERTLYEVNEGAGQVETCVNLTNPTYDILENEVGVEVFEHDTIKTNEHIPVGAAIADWVPPNEDYDRQRFGRNQLRRLRITEENRRICYNQTIVDDLRLEPTEYAGLTLQVRDSVTTIRTEVAIEHTTFRIIDNDVARVGFEQTFYRVAETVETVEICAEVFEPATDCPIEFAFDVTIETRDGTARDPGDYRRLSTQLSFLTCETRKCINVAIVNDNIAESPELFTARLGRTRALDPRITIDPISTTVEISDA